MWFVLWFLLLCTLSSVSHAAPIHSAALCTPASVQAAVDAAHDGDIVQLPTCTVTNWNATVTIGKSIHLKGNGRTNTRIKTVAGGIPNNGKQFQFIGTANNTGFRMSGMSLQGRQAGPEQLNDSGVLLSNAIDFAFHDMELYHFGIALHVIGNPTVMRGVIYNNIIRNNAKYNGGVLGYGIEIRGTGGLWPDVALGTINNIFVEDNTFIENRHSIESIGGSRYVVRYNTFQDGRENSSSIDAHGPNQSAYINGSRQWEIYHNVIDNTGVPQYPRFAGMGLRGGDGTIFNNTITNLNKEIVFWVEDAGQITNPNFDGCGCTYPCKSQWSGKINQIMEAHIWGNTPNNTIRFKDDPNSCHRNLIQEGRNYTIAARPGYTLHAVTGMTDFPAGKSRVYPLAAIYPHYLRDDSGTPPVTLPGAPQLVAITPL